MPLSFLKRLRTPKPAPAQERMHEVAGRSLPLRIVEHDRARRLTLRIDAGGRGLRVDVQLRPLDRLPPVSAGRTEERDGAGARRAELEARQEGSQSGHRRFDPGGGRRVTSR